MMMAAPQELVDIIATKLSGDERPDRITVQLDPPELGRVSIEFKFDSQGLQHVAVRGETSEAMKQLRLLHFDLVQSLEQHGLSARDMSFSQGSGDQQRQQMAADFGSGFVSGDDDQIKITPALTATRSLPSLNGASGLNIKL